MARDQEILSSAGGDDAVAGPIESGLSRYLITIGCNPCGQNRTVTCSDGRCDHDAEPCCSLNQAAEGSHDRGIGRYHGHDRATSQSLEEPTLRLRVTGR